jgi:hypothetical protein
MMSAHARRECPKAIIDEQAHVVAVKKALARNRLLLLHDAGASLPQHVTLLILIIAARSYLVKVKHFETAVVAARHKLGIRWRERYVPDRARVHCSRHEL